MAACKFESPCRETGTAGSASGLGPLSAAKQMASSSCLRRLTEESDMGSVWLLVWLSVGRPACRRAL